MMQKMGGGKVNTYTDYTLTYSSQSTMWTSAGRISDGEDNAGRCGTENYGS